MVRLLDGLRKTGGRGQDRTTRAVSGEPLEELVGFLVLGGGRCGVPYLLSSRAAFHTLAPCSWASTPRKNASTAASVSKSSHCSHWTSFGLWTRNRPELRGVYGTAIVALAHGKP